jgi:hypothetical protein
MPDFPGGRARTTTAKKIREKRTLIENIVLNLNGIPIAKKKSWILYEKSGHLLRQRGHWFQDASF